MNAAERTRIIACSDEWRALGEALGWRFVHCRYDWDASFLDAEDHTIHLTGVSQLYYCPSE